MSRLGKIASRWVWSADFGNVQRGGGKNATFKSMEDLSMKNTSYALGAVMAGLLLSPPTAPVAPAQDADASGLEEIVVLGSRRQDSSAEDLPVPVSVISGDDFLNQGTTDIVDQLARLVPSYNVNQQPISDAATFIRPANLRGLPPDATLVLVNGKRRHRAAVITFLGGGVNDGSQGPDISAIPSIALKRVEVLHDGASAQYGSDAIAGVINFVLKDAPEGGSVEARWGQFYEGDGDTFNVAANVGLPLTDAGFANFSFEYKEADPTSRSVQRGDAIGLIDAGNTAVRTPYAQIWGAPEFRYDYKFFGNVGIELGNGSEAYAFGNYAEREVEGGFFFRNPNTRPAIFDGPVLADGTHTIKVADLSADGMSGNCPVVRIVDNAPDPAALAAVAADPNCFAFNERFPGGFTPQFGGVMTDYSFALGTRGETAGGWFYDLSAVFGENSIDFFMKNTINPQLARQETNIPTEYRPGTYREQDHTFNLDISRPLDIGAFSSPVNVAFGAEYREEEFKIEAGGVNSWFLDERLTRQGFGVGSNGFSGFNPRAAGKNSRHSWAAYLELETNITDNFLLNGAVRYEDYENFGDTIDGKVSARLQVTDALAIRGSASTGFRVPTVGQANVRNVTTAFTNGVLADEATLPPTNPISAQKGGVPLTPEESVNFTGGVVLSLADLSVTLDYYHIEVQDRIALTSTLPLSPADIQALLAQGVSDATSYSGVRFFSNEFDTTTQGIDIAATYPVAMLGGETVFSFTGNWTDTKVDKSNPDIIGATRVLQLEEAIPDVRFSLSASHQRGPWRFLARGYHYGGFYEAHVNAGSLPINAKSRWFMDLEGAYTFNDSVTIVAGAQNLFDEYPTANPWDFVVGAKYPESSPYGFNGGFYYMRAIWKFN